MGGKNVPFWKQVAKGREERQMPPAGDVFDRCRKNMLLLLNCISSIQGFQGFGFGDGGFQMSFGIGAFPFGIFATAFNINDGRPPPGKTLLPW